MRRLLLAAALGTIAMPAPAQLLTWPDLAKRAQPKPDAPKVRPGEPGSLD